MAYLGEEIRKLGFGLMRLPQKDGKIDVEQTKEMVDLFLEAGFTYFDTAWAYAGQRGCHPPGAGRALSERSATSWPPKMRPGLTARPGKKRCAQFDTSLKQTGAGYFDFYLLHNLGEGRTQYFDDFDMWSWIAGKEAGKA